MAQAWNSLESLRAKALASSNETKSLKISPPALMFNADEIEPPRRKKKYRRVYKKGFRRENKFK